MTYQPDSLEEFAKLLRARGDYREAEFGTEILDLIDLEAEVAEPYGELCDDLDHNAPEELKGKPAKALERLIDRSDLLAEIETKLRDAGFLPEGTEIDDALDNALEIVADLEIVMRRNGWKDGEGDLIDALDDLAEKVNRAPPALEYDLRSTTIATAATVILTGAVRKAFAASACAKSAKSASRKRNSIPRGSIISGCRRVVVPGAIIAGSCPSGSA